MKTTIDFTKLGGLYFTQNVLAQLQAQYADVWDNLAAFFGDKSIISGCNVVGGNVSAGYVAVVTGGVAELLPFVGGANTGYCYVQSTTNNRQFNDTTQKGIIVTKQVVFTLSTQAGAFPFTSFVRLPYAAATLKDALNTFKSLFADIINLDAAVILSGCAVSDVDTGAFTLAIAAGTALVNGELVTAPAYAGAYPAYLQADGTYTTVEPGAGTYILFDPYTSQYYMDVLFRNQHRTGDVVMRTPATTLDSFDLATGLGRWRWLGWKLNTTLRGRTPLGYDARTADPADGVWDATYNTVGATLGEKKHQLSATELPNLSATIPKVGYSGIGGSGSKFVGNADTPDAGTQSVTVNSGGGASHENRQPSTVMLFIEKL